MWWIVFWVCVLGAGIIAAITAFLKGGTARHLEALSKAEPSHIEDRPRLSCIHCKSTVFYFFERGGTLLPKTRCPRVPRDEHDNNMHDGELICAKGHVLRFGFEYGCGHCQTAESIAEATRIAMTNRVNKGAMEYIARKHGKIHVLGGDDHEKARSNSAARSGNKSDVG